MSPATIPRSGVDTALQTTFNPHAIQAASILRQAVRLMLTLFGSAIIA